MLLQKLLLACLGIFLIMLFQSCDISKDSEQPVVFKQVPEIKEIKPEKPVKIKLKRNSKGDYSWEISGDDAEKILKAEKYLQKGLKNK